jgi:mRNA interferase RelE/StbE
LIRSPRQWQTSRRATIASSDEFKIAETGTFRKRLESQSYARYYNKLIENVYPRLRVNSYYGPNIKRLKGDLKSIFRYRIGDYRLFYTIDPGKKYVYILTLENRKDSYRKR